MLIDTEGNTIEDHSEDDALGRHISNDDVNEEDEDAELVPHKSGINNKRTSSNTSYSNGKSYHLGKHFYNFDRSCFYCGSNTTAIRKPKGRYKNIMYKWYRLSNDKTKWQCSKCYESNRYKIQHLKKN